MTYENCNDKFHALYQQYLCIPKDMGVSIKSSLRPKNVSAQEVEQQLVKAVSIYEPMLLRTAKSLLLSLYLENKSAFFDTLNDFLKDPPSDLSVQEQMTYAQYFCASSTNKMWEWFKDFASLNYFKPALLVEYFGLKPEEILTRNLTGKIPDINECLFSQGFSLNETQIKDYLNTLESRVTLGSMNEAEEKNLIETYLNYQSSYLFNQDLQKNLPEKTEISKKYKL